MRPRFNGLSLRDEGYLLVRTLKERILVLGHNSTCLSWISFLSFRAPFYTISCCLFPEDGFWSFFSRVLCFMWYFALKTRAEPVPRSSFVSFLTRFRISWPTVALLLSRTSNPSFCCLLFRRSFLAIDPVEDPSGMYVGVDRKAQWSSLEGKSCTKEEQTSLALVVYRSPFSWRVPRYRDFQKTSSLREPNRIREIFLYSIWFSSPWSHRSMLTWHPPWGNVRKE